MRMISCEICGENGVSFPVGKVRDWFLETSKKEFPVYRCAACGTYFLYPVPSINTIKKAYPKGYWWSGGGTGFLGRLMESYRRWGAGQMTRWIDNSLRKQSPSALQSEARRVGRFKKSLRVAELGSGIGTMLASGRDSCGWEVKGFDSSREAVERAREIYRVEVEILDLEKELPDLRGFDVIVMSHVLEHLGKPDKVLRSLKSLTKKEAKLVVAVPNANSLGERIFGLRWRGFDAPRHLRVYSMQGLRRLFEKNGWKVEKIGTFSARDDAAHLAGSLLPDWDPVVANSLSSVSLRKRVENGMKAVGFGAVTILLQPVAYLGGKLWMPETFQMILKQE